MSRAGRVAIVDQALARGKGRPLAHERPLTHPPQKVELPDRIREILRDEREYLGFYVSGNPLDHVDPGYFDGMDRASAVRKSPAGKWLSVVGIVHDSDVKQTKRGTGWARFTLEDSGGSCGAFCFGESAALIGDGFLVRVRGVVDVRDDERQLKVTKVAVLERW